MAAFDIETTGIPELQESVMYIWQFELGTRWCIIGRTWEEWHLFIDRLIFELHELAVVLPVYVHNLSYEFQFLAGQHEFTEVFATDPRKVLYAVLDQVIEFRCSLFLTNMGLDDFTKSMKVRHTKLSGKEFDYSVQRWPWTPLTDRELLYCVNDVRGLVEAVMAKAALEGDDMSTIPKTATGYVRRDVKEAMRKYSFLRLKSLWPSEPLFRMLRDAFRGGNTHANRYYTNMTLKDVTTYDRSSSYPDVMLNHQFPMSPFMHTGPMSPEDLDTWINVRKKAVLMNVTFTNIRLHDIYWGAPYLRRSKCWNLDEEVIDNGAVLEAGFLETAITDVDLMIIAQEYDFDDMCVTDSYVSTYGLLPEPLRDVVRDYYQRKTALKGVKGMINGVDAEILYNRVKALLNAIYGMAATNPAKERIFFEDGDYKLDTTSTADLLEAAGKHPYISYQWAPWVTAWARYELELGIRNVGSDSFVYCDTDSCKFIGEHDWTGLNARKELDSAMNGAYAVDANGEMHSMGVWEFDGKADKFRTLGAKKYVSETDGKIKLTLAGVTKKTGGDYLKERGGIDAFSPGFTFVGEDVAGVEAVYNDHRKGPTSWTTPDGHEIQIPRNVYLQPSYYKLSITGDYSEILKKAQQIFEYHHRNDHS